MIFYEFKLLPHDEQLRHVLAQGTFLAQRQEPSGLVSLYYLPDAWVGYFVEVGYEQAELELLVLRCFRSSVSLAAYVQGVELPG